MNDVQEDPGQLAPAFDFDAAPVNTVAVDFPPSDDVPDVSCNGLPVTAQLVYTAVIQKMMQTPPMVRRADDSDQGYIWRGALALVVEELWPGIGNTNRRGAVAVHAKTVINKYLRETHNMVCKERGHNTSAGVDRIPTWWVRDTWSYAPPVAVPRGLTRSERKVTRKEAGEDLVPAPVLVRKIVTAPQAVPCPAAGCGRTFAPNHLGAHKRWHTTYDRLVVQAARLLAALGDDSDGLKLSAVAEGIVHVGSIHRYFPLKPDLIDAARAYTLAHSGDGAAHAPAPPTAPAPPIVGTRWEEFKSAMADVIAYSNYRGLPVTDSMIAVMAADTKKPARMRAVLELVAEGVLRTTTMTDFRNRPFKAYVPTTAWAPPATAAPPVVELTLSPITPREALERFIAEHDAALAEAAQLRKNAADRTADLVRIERLETDLAATSAKLTTIQALFA